MAKGEAKFGVGGYTHGVAYTDELAAEIVSRIGTGEPLRVICRDAHMPHHDTVSEWRKARTDFDSAMNEAREAGHDSISWDCILISDNSPLTELGSKISALTEKLDEGEPDVARVVEALEGLERKFNDMVQERKLRIETRLKLLAKWNPRYAEKMQLAHSGEIGKREMTDEELDAEITKRLAEVEKAHG